MESGIIVKGIGGFYDVLLEDRIVQCIARGKFRKTGLVPMVGDYARISSANGTIEEILPRKNQLLRPPVANIDYLGVVIAVKEPEPDFMLVDKLFISAESMKIHPMLIINKIDLAEGDDVLKIRRAYDKTGYPIVEISSKFGIGIESLKAAMQPGIFTLAGQSGVGKSSILNCLLPGLSLETREISNKIKRGRHTTRAVELLRFSREIMVVDTPGFSAIEMSRLEEEELQDYYPEFRLYKGQCRFSSCVHHHEPECMVKQMVEEGKISEDRYLRYLKILSEVKENRRDDW